jgi:hypothetical protein
VQVSHEFPPEVQEAYRACEQRLENIHTPFLDAARRLDDPVRRSAFYAAYVSMRVNGPANLPRPVGHAPTVEASRLALRAWRDSARLCSNRQPDSDHPDEIALADTMARFGIPMTPWIRLEQGLIEVAENHPVPDLVAMVDRGRRLGGAQSWVFLRILIAKRGVHRFRVPAPVDVEELAADPGIFAYIVRKMIDVFAELDWWETPRSSFPEVILDRHELDVDQLREMRTLTQAPRDFFEMMNDMALVAWRYYESGVASLAQAAAHLPREGVIQVDSILEGYKNALRTIQKSGFSPKEVDALAGARRGRAPSRVAGFERPEAPEPWGHRRQARP